MRRRYGKAVVDIYCPFSAVFSSPSYERERRAIKLANARRFRYDWRERVSTITSFPASLLWHEKSTDFYRKISFVCPASFLSLYPRASKEKLPHSVRIQPDVFTLNVFSLSFIQIRLRRYDATFPIPFPEKIDGDISRVFIHFPRKTCTTVC